MKIRNYLLVSISYLGLSSLAWADSYTDENKFIFTHTSNNIHLNSQRQLLSFPIFPKQTQSEQRDFSAPISLALTDGPTASVASVCFITDAGNCAGVGGAAIDEKPTSSGGPDDWYLDTKQQCINSGYDCTPCPDGQKPEGLCPFDKECHVGCKTTCAAEFNKTCNGADETGKGEACGRLYKECCRICAEYPYTSGSLPNGHVATASCVDCNGQTKVQSKCDTNSGNNGKYIDCGNATGSGNSCADDSGVYYTECKCPTNYEFNAETKNCVCKTNFKYACTGSGYAGGSGESCDNKYQTCDCAEGYQWSSTSGCVVCDNSFKYTCTGANESKPAAGDCGGKYTQCNCASGYEWNGSACVVACSADYKYTCTGTGYSGGSGTACGGKYTKCRCKSPYTWTSGACQCPSTYKYTCKGTGDAGGLGTACGGKYTKCNCNSPYTWTSGACLCPSTYLYTCSGSVYAGGSGTSCGERYTRCNCKSPYTWSGSACTCPSTYTYTCSGTGYSGGSGTACAGKYEACTCSDGYNWENGSCQKPLNGPQGNLYYCDGKVVGVKADGMYSYLTLTDIYYDLGEASQGVPYSCTIAYAPGWGELNQFYDNKSVLNSLLLKYGGKGLTNDYYWSSDCMSNCSKYGYGKYVIVSMADGSYETSGYGLSWAHDDFVKNMRLVIRR